MLSYVTPAESWEVYLGDRHSSLIAKDGIYTDTCRYYATALEDIICCSIIVFVELHLMINLLDINQIVFCLTNSGRY